MAKLLGAKPAEVGNGAELIYEVEDVEGKLPQGEGRFGVGVHNGHRDLAQFRSNRGADPRATGRRTIIYRCVYKPSLKRTATRTSAAAVDQLGKQLCSKQEVIGSNPIFPPFICGAHVFFIAYL